MENKHNTLRRLICLAMALALLVPLSLPAKAASQKDSFGVVKDSFDRTLPAVAVKNGSEILVFTSSENPIKVGTPGIFSVDGNTTAAVEMISNYIRGSIQCWQVTEKTSIGSNLYETAQPVSGQDIAALYPAIDSSDKLVARQTAASVDAIYGNKDDLTDVAVGYCLRKNPNAFPDDIAAFIGLLLDGSGKAVGILCGRNAAWCPWYSTASASADPGSFSLGDSEIASREFVSYVYPDVVVNPHLMSVSFLYNALMTQLAQQDQNLDYCAGAVQIPYRQDNLSTLLNGKKIAKGVSYSFQRTITMGMDACIDDDSYWCLSLTFPQSTLDLNTFERNAYALIFGTILADVGITPHEDPDKNTELTWTILAKLLEDGQSTAVTCEDVTFFLVFTSNSLILGVDSENYFENYPTSIRNFKTVS